MDLLEYSLETEGILPPSVRPSFSGHQTFSFRFAWPAKAVRGVAADPSLFYQADAMVRLGVGKNMVDSMRFWVEALGLTETDHRARSTSVTELGRSIFHPEGWDPYVEDQATLWLLHWQLVDNPAVASAFSLLFGAWARDTFTKDELLAWLVDVARLAQLKKASATSLKRDVDVVVRTYASADVDRRRALEDTFDCPLVELGLIHELEPGLFEVQRTHRRTLPAEVLSYALSTYWERYLPGQSSVSFERILHDRWSPGMAFRLTSESLNALLGEIEDWSGFRYDETAGVRTVFLVDSDRASDRLSMLRRHYDRWGGDGQA